MHLIIRKRNVINKKEVKIKRNESQFKKLTFSHGGTKLRKRRSGRPILAAHWPLTSNREAYACLNPGTTLKSGNLFSLSGLPRPRLCKYKDVDIKNRRFVSS